MAKREPTVEELFDETYVAPIEADMAAAIEEGAQQEPKLPSVVAARRPRLAPVTGSQTAVDVARRQYHSKATRDLHSGKHIDLPLEKIAGKRTASTAIKRKNPKKRGRVHTSRSWPILHELERDDTAADRGSSGGRGVESADRQ